MLALHWATAFPLAEVFPRWRVIGLAVGTVLVLIQYLSLLAGVLRQIQKRNAILGQARGFFAYAPEGRRAKNGVQSPRGYREAGAHKRS